MGAFRTSRYVGTRTILCQGTARPRWLASSMVRGFPSPVLGPPVTGRVARWSPTAAGERRCRRRSSHGRGDARCKFAPFLPVSFLIFNMRRCMLIERIIISASLAIAGEMIR